MPNININLSEFQNVVIVNNKADLPAAVGGVITLEADTTYIVAASVDLTGDRLVTSGVCNLFGYSSEVSFLTSTGLGAGVPLITSEWTIVIEKITIKDVNTAFSINGNTRTIALDWENVNFDNVPNVGVINTCDNFIFDTGSFLGAQGLIFTGTIGTIALNNSLFRGLGSAGNIIELDSSLIVTRRFRMIYSSVIATGTTVGINVSTSATIPTESYILDTVYFSGGSTYLSGVDYTSIKALFTGCVGIRNTESVGAMYMKNNAIATDILVQNDRYNIAGVTQSNGLNQRFIHDAANNALQYVGIQSKVFNVILTFTISPAQNNQKYGIYIGVNRGGALDPSNDRITESEAYINTPQAGRADAAAIQALVELNTNDKIYMIVQNTTSTADVTVEFMNMVIR